MTIRIACSSCQAPYQLPDNLLGKKVKCRHCRHQFVVTAGTPAGPQPEPRLRAEEGTAEKVKPDRSPPAAPRRRAPSPPEDEIPSVLPVSAAGPDEDAEDEEPRRRVRHDDAEEEGAEPKRPEQTGAGPAGPGRGWDGGGRFREGVHDILAGWRSKVAGNPRSSSRQDRKFFGRRFIRGRRRGADDPEIGVPMGRGARAGAVPGAP